MFRTIEDEQGLLTERSDSDELKYKSCDNSKIIDTSTYLSSYKFLKVYKRRFYMLAVY